MILRSRLLCVDDFFIGIGDINSTFLPKVDAMSATNVTQAPSTPSQSAPPTQVPSSPPPSLPVDDQQDSEEGPDELSDEKPSVSKSEMIARNALALEAQLEERPLAKKQEELESDDDEAEKPNDLANSDPRVDGQSNGTSAQADHTKVKHHRRALLKNDDDELKRIGRVRTFDE